MGASSNVPGRNNKAMDAAVIVTAEAQPTTLHRGDGSLPSGNSRMRKVPISPMAGTHDQLERAATKPTAGKEPGSVRAP
jgi:hypothetical protein